MLYARIKCAIITYNQKVYMEYNLKNMKMLAFGAQAEIYEIDESKVLRALRNPEDRALLQTEIDVTKALKEAGVDVPQVFEYVEAEGREAGTAALRDTGAGSCRGIC